MEAILNFMQTIFVVVILGAGSAMFAKDANKLVLFPVERMIQRLNRWGIFKKKSSVPHLGWAPRFPRLI